MGPLEVLRMGLRGLLRMGGARQYRGTSHMGPRRSLPLSVSFSITHTHTLSLSLSFSIGPFSLSVSNLRRPLTIRPPDVQGYLAHGAPHGGSGPATPERGGEGGLGLSLGHSPISQVCGGGCRKREGEREREGGWGWWWGQKERYRER